MVRQKAVNEFDKIHNPDPNLVKKRTFAIHTKNLLNEKKRGHVMSAIHLRKTKAVQYAASTLAAASAPASSSSDGIDTGRETVKSIATEDAPVKNPLEESIRDVDDAKIALNNCKNEGIALKSKLEKLQEEKRTLFVTLKKVLKRDSERRGWH